MNPTLNTATAFLRQRKGLPQNLILFVTSRCNARCDFCLYWDQINDPVPRSQELTVEEVEMIARNYGPLNDLSLSGGEPFVRSDIAEICQAFVDHCDTKVLDIPSNFWFTDKMVAALETLASRNPGVLIEVQLSLDHVGPAHDESRKVAGLFERVKETMAALAPIRERHANLRVKASVVWLERNRDEFFDVAGEIDRTFDVDRIHVAYPNRIIPPSGNPEVADDVHRFTEAWRQLDRMPGQATDLYSIGIRAARYTNNRLLTSAAEGRAPVGDFCEAGRWIAVVDERGEVYPCEPLWESVGNLRDHDYDLHQVFAGPRYAAFREAHLGNGSCNCTWGVALSTSIASRPRYFPELVANSVRVALGRRRPIAVSPAPADATVAPDQPCKAGTLPSGPSATAPDQPVSLTSARASDPT